LIPSRNLVIPVVAAAALVAFFLLSSPIPQDPAYHQFADARTLLGVSNFWNVMSNLPLMVIGLWGTLIVFRHHDILCLPGLELPYIVFFTGIILTAFGSAYYHLSPANDPLVWDRLPMTIGFAGLFSLILGEFVSPRIGRTVLIPLLLIGIASVEYWAYTETNGHGDLRPYVVVQFLPMMLVPAILLTYKPAIGSAKYFWYMLLFYVLAKLFEFIDGQLYAAGGIISGHSLKHVFAAMASAAVLFALIKRRQVFDGDRVS